MNEVYAVLTTGSGLEDPGDHLVGVCETHEAAEALVAAEVEEAMANTATILTHDDGSNFWEVEFTDYGMNAVWQIVTTKMVKS